MAYLPVSAVQFYLLFSPVSRIAIKKSDDPLVKEFWASFQMMLDAKGEIDLGDSEVIKDVHYLAATNQNPTPATAWVVDHAYSVGNQSSVGTNVYTCTTAGTSAATGTGPSGVGVGIVDGSCVWSYAATPYIGPDEPSRILKGQRPA